MNQTTKLLYKIYSALLRDMPMSMRCTVEWQANLASMRSELAKAYGVDEQDLEYVALKEAQAP